MLLPPPFPGVLATARQAGVLSWLLVAGRLVGALAMRS
jgi:hypothetical protein